MSQTSPKVRTVLVGCGGMGQNHLKALAAHGGYELVAGCDINPAFLEKLPPDVNRYTGAKLMFKAEKPELAVLVLPNFLYEPMVKLAVRAGCDVLCEKPLGQSLKACRRIIQTVERSGRRAWVSGQFKCHSHIRAVMGRVREMKPRFVTAGFHYFSGMWRDGQVSLGWRGEKDQGGGYAVIDNGWHTLDYLSWFMGHPETVSCALTPFAERPAVDAYAAVTLTYAGGTVAQLTMNPADPNFDLKLRFFAAPRTIQCTWNKTEFYEICDLKETIESDKSDPLVTLYAELAKARAGDAAALITDLARAEKVMEVVDAAYRSAATGKVIRLKASPAAAPA